MTEKRYKAIPETGEYKDTVTGEFLSPKFEEGFYKVLDLLNENEELKQVLGSILIEVKRQFSTHKTGEIRVFLNPNSFNLISDVLRKYGALKGWSE